MGTYLGRSILKKREGEGGEGTFSAVLSSNLPSCQIKFSNILLSLAFPQLIYRNVYSPPIFIISVNSEGSAIK
jgi:hypothetical protein